MVDKVQVKGRLQLYWDVSAGPLLEMKVHSDSPQLALSSLPSLGITSTGESPLPSGYTSFPELSFTKD